MTNFKPMLAGKAPADLSALKYPVIASPKLDGIRAVSVNGVMVSRKLKPIPNRFIQEHLRGMPDGVDGELIVGSPFGADVMNRTSSGVMSADGEPDFIFYAFDSVGRGAYSDRLRGLAGIPTPPRCVRITSTVIRSADELLDYESSIVSEGYEGVMLRSPDGPYKFGRSTEREGYLLKLKRFQDAEALVIGMVERFHNGNEATIDELGHTKRSSHKANKSATGTMGALVCMFGDPRPSCKDCEGTGQRDSGGTHPWGEAINVPCDCNTFEIGTGFTDEQRLSLWMLGADGLTVTFKFQALTPDGVPRFPVFKGFRHD